MVAKGTRNFYPKTSKTSSLMARKHPSHRSVCIWNWIWTSPVAVFVRYSLSTKLWSISSSKRCTRYFYDTFQLDLRELGNACHVFQRSRDLWTSSMRTSRTLTAQTLIIVICTVYKKIQILCLHQQSGCEVMIWGAFFWNGCSKLHLWSTKVFRILWDNTQLPTTICCWKAW